MWKNFLLTLPLGASYILNRSCKHGENFFCFLYNVDKSIISSELPDIKPIVDSEIFNDKATVTHALPIKDSNAGESTSENTSTFSIKIARKH